MLASVTKLSELIESYEAAVVQARAEVAELEDVLARLKGGPAPVAGRREIIQGASAIQRHASGGSFTQRTASGRQRARRTAHEVETEASVVVEFLKSRGGRAFVRDVHRYLIAEGIYMDTKADLEKVRNTLRFLERKGAVTGQAGGQFVLNENDEAPSVEGASQDLLGELAPSM